MNTPNQAMNKTVHCFIIDDEPDARELLKKFISRVPYLELAGEFGNAVDALFQVQISKPDLIFLDVEMPEMTGFEFIRAIQGHNPKIIMITAYQEYAMAGFEHNVTDYLLKPASFERFIRAVNKVTDLLPAFSNAILSSKSSAAENLEAERVLNQQKKETNSGKDFLLIKEDKKLVRVIADEIVLVEAMKDYIKIHLPQRTIVTHNTMSKMESMLPEGNFLRINRSFIVRINAIREIDGNQIVTTDGKKVDIGVTYRETVMETLKK
ncbi:two component transcriptional regulator, LytTR family [Dyadobacter koreensis]|uniref:Two component transcriptional regulator, LytTR family n=2 Tax=Dyadobacter koreensis TaxID=408657 RepID=A0A1H7AGV8_9BACT|nr:two component transcriptional regulator, LytTR family [Dyadobacter koreensis]